MRHHADRRHCAFLRFIQICATLILTSVMVTACGSGHGVDSEDNPLAGLFGDLFSSSSGKSFFDKDKSSSSSNGKSSSSVKSSSSIDFFDYSPTNNKYDFSKDSTAVKSVADLGKCENGDRRGVIKDSSYYYCAYETWFKEVGSLPKCTKQNDLTTFYKGVPYMCVSGELKILSEMEAKLGLCTKAKQGKIKESNNFKYICDDLIWTKQSITEVHGKCTIETNGTTVKYGNKDYICRWSSWNEFSELESDSGACTKDRFGELLRIKTSSYYDEYTYYVCKDFDWSKTTDPADIFGACNSKMTDSIYVIKSNSYVCENSEWRKTTSVEDKYGLCNAKMQDSLYKLNSSTYMVCDKGSWRSATVEEVYGKCTAALQDTLYSYDSKTYACNNLKWIVLPDPPSSSLSYCTKKNENTTYKTTSPKAYYICSNYAWQKIDSLSYVYGLCNKDSLGARKTPHADSLGYECMETSSGYGWLRLTINDYGIACNADIQDSVFKGYICDNSKWRMLTALEKSVGICSAKNIGENVKSGSKYYECKSSGWTSISEEDYTVSITPCNEENDSTAIKTKTAIYFCAEGKWFVPPPSTGSGCYYGENEGQIATSGNGYLLVCNHSGWNIVDDLVYTVGMCTQKRNGLIVPHDKYFAKCQNGYWTSASTEEYLASRPCSEKVSMSGLEYTCSNGVWSPSYGTLKDSRDSKTYRTLKVGEQTWMIDNLKYRTANSWCHSDLSKCNDYGMFYTWEDGQSACPDGWRVPSAYEFRNLTGILPRIEIKDFDYWQSSPNDQDVYKGFELRGAGIRTDEGNIDYERRVAGFWYADSLDKNTAFAEIYGIKDAQNFTESLQSYPYDSNDSKSPKAYGVSKNLGLNIRCIKD